MISPRTGQGTPLGGVQLMTALVEDAVAIKVNARVVEFIAKPEKTDELRNFLCKAVTQLLRDRTGFIRSMVLTTLEEPRRLAVISFWSTEELTVLDPWEEAPLVRELLSPLIDAWSSIRNYRVDLTEATEAHSQATSLPI